MEQAGTLKRPIIIFRSFLSSSGGHGGAGAGGLPVHARQSQAGAVARDPAAERGLGGGAV